LDEIAAMPFDGLALGGFSVGEPTDVMHELLASIAPRMPDDRPRYLMGVGTPSDLLRAVGSGVDLFDCVLPTRNARNGQALTWSGRVNLRQARHREDDAPLDAICECATCRTFPRGYLRHLFKAKEMLAPRLITLHNLHFYGALMEQARQAIGRGGYEPWARSVLERMAQGNEVGPGAPGRQVTRR
jgi:queuine tRNA-ribosyltransferase